MFDAIATVEKIYLYPVKSMAGTLLDEAHVGLDGIFGDRQYAFVQAEKAEKNSFPWMTARENARMLTYEPRFERVPTAVEPEPGLRVQTPGGRLVEVSDAALRDEIAGASGRPIYLLKSARGVFDSQHLSLFSLASVRRLAAEAECSIDHRQFRANLYFEPRSTRAFEEEQWMDCLLQIGERVLTSVAQRDPRCMMINLDPETGKQNPQVLKTIAQRHGGDAGLYLTVIRPGVIRHGDAIRRIPMPE
ncbi:MAG: MOSC domain-containing protein [Candidatus Acidiferrales bacterium]